MEWNEIASWLFKAGGAAVALYVANEFRRIGDILTKMGISIEDLKISSAVVVEKVGSHEKRIERLEERD